MSRNIIPKNRPLPSTLVRRSSSAKNRPVYINAAYVALSEIGLGTKLVVVLVGVVFTKAFFPWSLIVMLPYLLWVAWIEWGHRLR